MDKLLLSAVTLLVMVGCASQRPVLYPNEQFKRDGNATAEREINACLRQADDYVAADARMTNGFQGTATSTASSATIGATTGAVGGAIAGRAGPSAAIGAAGGGAAALTQGLIHGLSSKPTPSPLYKDFVNRCLREKGYDLIGWQ